MCVEDYHHYDDWKAEMEKTYDQFNMLQLPDAKTETKLYFDSRAHNRRIPKGIFPHPLNKRTVLEPNSMEPLQIMSGHVDKYSEFEQDPLRYMRKQELKKMKDLKPITPDVSMMANL